MTTNISARYTYIDIGGVDYTPQLIALSGSDSHVEGSGLMSFQGSLALAPSINVELDDWITDAFETGTPVIIDTHDENRIFQRHPRGALRIIRPAFNETTQQQEIRVGDLIALLDYRQPTDDEAILISAETGTTVQNVVDQILNLTGINNILWRTSIAAQYQFLCPVELQSGYLATVDRILYSFGLLGWINNQEQFVIDQINMSPLAASFVIELGQHEAGDPERLNNKPIPAEVVRVFGNYRKLKERPQYTERQLALETGPIDDLIPGNQGGTGILRWEWEIEEYNPNASSNQVITYRYLNLLRYWVYQGYDGFQRIGNARAQTDTVRYSYETDGSKRLKSIHTKTRKPTVLVISNFAAWAKENNETVFNNLILGQTIDAAESLVNYAYNAEEQVIQIDEYKWESVSDIIAQLSLDWQIVYDSFGVPNDLRQSSFTRTAWKRVNEGWLRLITRAIAKARDPKYQEALPLRLEAGELEPADVVREATSLIFLNNSQRDSSNSGITTPPAAEHLPRRFIDTQCTIEAAINFPQYASQFRPRERAIEIPYLPDTLNDAGAAQAVANRFGQIQGALLKGQFKGMRIPMPLTNVLFSDYRPLLPFDLYKPNSSRFRLAMDGTTWSLTSDQCLVSTDAIYLARLTDGVPIPPYLPSTTLIGGMVMGAYIDTTETPIGWVAGLIMGASIDFVSDLILCWDTLTPDQFDQLTPIQWDVLQITCRRGVEICWDSLTPQLFDQLSANQWDRLAIYDCIIVFKICWDNIQPSEWDSITAEEMDALAIYDCAYL